LAHQEKPPLEGVAEDVVSALLNLGYKRVQAERAVEDIFLQNPDLSLERALKASLKILANL
jgi:Holliday junction resolvasome RuvABC DNA-binding subunit